MNKIVEFVVVKAGSAPITYLLRDDFLTDRAAGAVNNTASEPGGIGSAALNNRLVVDTTGMLTISDDKLVCAGGLGTPVWTDPNMRYGELVARAQGRAIVACVQPKARDKDWQIGWTRTASSTVRSHGFYFGSDDKISVWENNGLDSAYASYTPYAEFLIAISLRAAGADFLIKGDQNYQVWTKLKTTTSLADANMWAAIENNSAPFAVSTFRIPNKNYQPYIDAGNYSILDKVVKPYSSCNCFALGDSRTVSSAGAGKWPSLLTRYSRGYEFLEKPTRLAGSAWKVVNLKVGIDASLAAASGTPTFAWIDIGINDNGVTAEASFKSDFQYVLDAIHTKWPNIYIYVDNVDKDATDTTDINAWINFVIASRSTFTLLGTDEADYLPGNTTDGVHFTEYGYYLKASAILTRLGYTP